MGRAAPGHLESSNDPDVSAEGVVSWDADDDWFRVNDGTNQVVAGQKTKLVNVTIAKPNGLDEATNLVVWRNETGATFNITAIRATCDTDNVACGLYEIADYTDFSTRTLIEELSITTDGTSVYYQDMTVTASIDHTVIEDGHLIVFDNDPSDDPGYLSFILEGWLDANVN